MNEVKKLIINGVEFVVTDGGAVAFDTTQLLSENQKETARQNIGAAAVGEAGGGGSADAVLYIVQSLTNAQKAQARENIGAASAEEIGGIETALDAIIDIQNSLIGGDGA